MIAHLALTNGHNNSRGSILIIYVFISQDEGIDVDPPQFVVGSKFGANVDTYLLSYDSAK